jgi:V/A-type H+-transporting ATPase subunit A
MTQSSMQAAGTFWALDYDLSRRRHFPAINWMRSYSLYETAQWFAENVAEEWSDLTRAAMALLQREEELLGIVRLVGPDALAEAERAVLATARMLREDFFHQSAYHPVDRFCPLDKAYWMLKAILALHHQTEDALQVGVDLETIASFPQVAEIARMKEIEIDRAVEEIQALIARTQASFDGMRVT